MATQRADVLRRGYALVVFNPNDCAEETTLRNLDGSWAFRNTRFFPAYPGYDWGILTGWAWGASRVADFLEGDTDTISLPEAVRQSILGARPAYALSGEQDRLGVHFARLGHAFTPDDWSAMLDFFDWHLRGTPTTRGFDRFPTEQELDAALAATRAAAPPARP